MRVVLDTNLFISALLSGRGAPARIVDAWRAGKFELVTSTEQIEEFKRATGYEQIAPYVSRSAAGRFVNQLRRAEVLLKRLPRGSDAPDPDDAYLIAMAVASDAQYLVTGDKILISVGLAGTSSIVSVHSFTSVLARLRSAPRARRTPPSSRRQ